MVSLLFHLELLNKNFFFSISHYKVVSMSVFVYKKYNDNPFVETTMHLMFSLKHYALHRQATPLDRIVLPFTGEIILNSAL